MSKTGNALVALIAGVAVGVGAGILFAPDEGKNTRKKIKKQFDESSANLKDQLDGLADQVKSKANDMKGTFEENISNLVSKSSHKADDIISVLEKKLAELKNANAKLQK
ncbi:MAG: YtxH domain-containing protein [Capnocytophaga sp.]|nr:YtxH domain-containing protein [Capnocytophaga sp.]